MHRPSRRTFLKSSAAIGSSMLLDRQAYSRAAIAADATKTKLTQFEYADVKLLDGPMLDQFNRNTTRSSSALNEDALLKPFREARRPSRSGAGHGWLVQRSPKTIDPPKNMTGYIAGHTFGQYLSGLSRAYAVTGDKPTQEKVQRLVKGFGATVTRSSIPTIRCLPTPLTKPTWASSMPTQFAGDPMALPVLGHATDAVLPHLAGQARRRELRLARCRTRTSPTVGTRLTPFQKTFTSPTCAAAIRAIANWRSDSFRIRTTSSRSPKERTSFPVFMPTAISTRFVPQSRLIWWMAATCICERRKTDSSSFAPRRALPLAVGDPMKPSACRAAGIWARALTKRTPASRPLAARTDISRSLAISCASLATAATATAWKSVLYNTILGAMPIQPDGTSFYYCRLQQLGTKFYPPG